MAFNGNYEKDENGIDRIIEERGNQFLAMRMVRWNDNKEFKLDIRKYVLSETGETPLKGISFLTEEGPDELTKILVEEGFGNNTDLFETIKEKRPELESYFIRDYLDRDNKDLQSHLDTYPIIEDNTEEYYDPEELLL